MESKTKLLVIDDQIGSIDSPHNRAFLRAYSKLPYDFVFESCDNSGHYSLDNVILTLSNYPDIALVLLDIKFGSESTELGYDILALLIARFPSIPVLMMSSVDRDVESLGRCLEEGAIGFIAKAIDADNLHESVERAISIANSHVLLGQSQPLRELRRQAARLSPYGQIPVMLVGGRGTGKERVARYIHHNGPRSCHPFVPINCGGLSDSLLEAELFGAEKGAYTDACSLRIGYLERSNRGVLFLDEIGNMPIATQAKFLRVLQDKKFRRVGVSEREIELDFQVICATNVAPEELIENGKLREDFYDRVAAVTVRTPLLRECKSDIPELVSHFLRELGVQVKKHFAKETLHALEKYDWPGNMRELRSVVQEAVVRSESSMLISVEHLPTNILTSQSGRLQKSRTTQTQLSGILPENHSDWPRKRLIDELQLAVAAKRQVQQYKGKHWKAEFMRLMYPECKAANAKGFDDLIRRLTQGPWGLLRTEFDAELTKLLDELDD